MESNSSKQFSVFKDEIDLKLVKSPIISQNQNGVTHTF